MTQEQVLGIVAVTLLAAYAVGVVLPRRRPKSLLGRDVRTFGFLRYAVSGSIGLIVFLASPTIAFSLLDFVIPPGYRAFAWTGFAFYFLYSMYLPLGALGAFVALSRVVEIVRSRPAGKQSVFSVAMALGCAVGLLVTLIACRSLLRNEKGSFAYLAPTAAVGGVLAGIAIVRFLARPEKQAPS